MQDRSCEQTVPLSLMLKEAYSSEKRSHEGYSENTSEASSSHDSFYDSLSDMHDGEFSNELSAFLSQEEINKSLDLAQEAIANSKKEDQNKEQEFSHYFNTSLPISSENASSRETKVHEQEALGRLQIRSPISLSITPQTFQEQLKQQSPMSPRTASSFFSGKEANISSLLPASPSFIRSLKNAQKCGPSLQKTSSKSKSVLQEDAPFKSKLCDKAATFIEELSSIFREAAKTRGRSPDGDSSSPDSGYLSPKKKQSAMMNATVSQIPGETYEKSKSEIELSGEHQNGEPFHEKKNVTQQNETVLRHQLSNVGGQKSSAPRFIQKLKSQEVAEGTKVLLSCRVAGNPIPHVR